MCASLLTGGHRGNREKRAIAATTPFPQFSHVQLSNLVAFIGNTWLLYFTLLVPTLAWGHGNPIYVAIEQSTNQAKIFAGFDNAVLDTTLSTDTPGLGVVSPTDGVNALDLLSLRVTQGLLYSDGATVTTTDASLTIFSAEFVEIREVTADAGVQTVLPWAVYPEDAVELWDADGFYQLSPNAPQGVYGLGLQVLVDGAIASEPFLLPMINGSTSVQSAIALLQAELLHPSVADFDRDWQVGATDLAIWQANLGDADLTGNSRVFGDADVDGNVTGYDFLYWQRHVDPVDEAAALAANVPEPATWVLLISIILCAAKPHRFVRVP